MSGHTPHKMYYIAIVCPEEINKKVLDYKLWMRDRFGCTVALKSPAHITLIPPFWLAEEREKELHAALQSFSGYNSKPEIQLDNFSRFGKRVLFIHVKENPALEELKKQAENHFVKSFTDVIRIDERPFHPHVTIAGRDLKPGDFVKAWPYFAQKKFEEIFFVSNISLLKLEDGKWNVIGENNFDINRP
ncbi:MAG: 2'-5' RNA ligase family protein [Chitinophagaceae bacterium]|nr:2'-5' RNA ligase family protein [Chitinophagaceae bacterium]